MNYLRLIFITRGHGTNNVVPTLCQGLAYIFLLLRDSFHQKLCEARIILKIRELRLRESKKLADVYT